jgi:Zn-dependent protease with chaperone function
MSDASRNFTSLGFAKTFLLPALLIFLVPVVSLAFFLHAQSWFNSQARTETLSQIGSDASLTPEEREEATKFFTEHPFSELVKNKEFAAQLEPSGVRYFTMFRWLIRLSVIAILASIAVFIWTGLCVLFSLRSHQAQYISLSAGWHVLRIYGALQAIIQGILLTALSFWVTALWLEMYSVKLVLAAGLVALVAVGITIMAIFKRANTTQNVEGTVIDNQSAMPLWNELRSICDKVGTAPPDQVIVGIDDNFFVTELPVTVNGKTYTGRTLYVSLSLLKQMNGAEADSVLAHEMAHFSGNDTLYSKKISPMLVKYGTYLQDLYQAGITRPIFYVMHCFRALFELSLGKLSRQREFRADRIAAETTSNRDFATALLRIAAYSKFRGDIQKGLFDQEKVLESANISQQIENGFHGYAASFATSNDIAELETSHPFDSHPPMAERLNAIGYALKSQDATALLSQSGDGRWYAKIDGAAEIEAGMWREFEEGFRKFHEESLAYRFLPETPEELAHVVKAFPKLTIDAKIGSLILDHEGLHYTEWPTPVKFSEVTQFAMDDSGNLTVNYNRSGKQKEKIKMKTFGPRQQEAIDAINRYYGRHMYAQAYREEKNKQAAAIVVSTKTGGAAQN